MLLENKQKKKKHLTGRYILCVTGLLLCAFGVAFITKASLGNTPLSATPFTLSLIFTKLTYGNFSIGILMIFILLQIIILRRKLNVIDILLQIPLSFLFGFVIDFSMWVLIHFQPEGYGPKLVSLLVGCSILSFGVYLQLVADVTMLPIDGFTHTVSKVTGKDFGNVKLITDGTQVAVAVVLGLIVLKSLAGVREGTLIGVVYNSYLIKILLRTVHLERIFAK